MDVAEVKLRIPRSPYLVCAHCHCDFLASDRQLKRTRSLGYSGRTYCSAICQRVGASAGRPKKKMNSYAGNCQRCGMAFESRYAGRKYCSMKCYTSTTEFMERVRSQSKRANAAAVLKATGELPKPCIEIECLNCGTRKILKPSRAHEKFCNKRCYREYMALRFDRWIAAPQTIALPQGYDEFLSSEELPCLVDGCNWVGVHLGNHVNMAHGIPADEFKRAAGFNKRTGLVTPALSEQLSGRPHIHENPFGGQAGSRDFRNHQPITKNYRSLEGSEHAAKARALMLDGPELPPRICIGCGKEYSPGPIAFGAKFCSFDCRNSFYAKNIKMLKFWLNCGECRKDFQGGLYQQRSAERGNKVFCSRHCRQVNNGKIAGAKHHQRYLERIRNGQSHQVETGGA